MFSLNVPAPGRVKRLAAEFHPRLASFERVRERHSLVCKRFESEEYDRLSERARRALDGTTPIEARVTTIELFEEPVRGPGPVVYLAVASPGLVAIHERLVDAFGAITGLEGDEYVPHVTLARGGSVDRAEALRARTVDSIEWTISELSFYDATHDERAGTLSLPVSY
ncbi:2'-5' RNA ligase family protein [Halococcus qingdaonensis]|uniref:2'-5' RNA ligase family protein n=1 Tax=Halococcus qingdaonensis TaxID=224402 RepID=UPI002116082D|nr:2'-5' RNA ligase family protein [Halococcus qingdaonensis]